MTPDITMSVESYASLQARVGRLEVENARLRTDLYWARLRPSDGPLDEDYEPTVAYNVPEDE